jgi:hypothetical protein
MANKNNERGLRAKNITKSDKARANRFISAAISRSGATKKESDLIKRTIWELRSIVSRDRDSGYLKAATSIATDIGPEYAIAAISRLGYMGLVNDDEVESITKSIEKKHNTDKNNSLRIGRLFNQAADAVTESGIGVLAPKVINGRTIGSGGNRYKTTFSNNNPFSGETVERATSDIARDYYASAGLGRDVADELMPVSGYIVHGDQLKKKRQLAMSSGVGNVESDAIFELSDEDIIGDGLTAHGEIEIVLKPGVSGRVSYGMGNGIKNGNKPVRLNSTNKEDVSDALSNLDGANGKTESLEAMLNLLAANIDKDFADVNSSLDESGSMRRSGQFDSGKRNRKPLEAHILGGFDIDEIEQINYPFTKLQKMAANQNISDVISESFINNALVKNGFTLDEIEYMSSTGMISRTNTESMDMLRSYRLAVKMRDKYQESGVDKFMIAHPSGINIFNPLSHSKAARPGQDVEEVLKENIELEIAEMAKKLMKEIRSSEKPSLISRRGGKL